MRRRTALVVVLAIAGALLPRAASAVVATSCSFDAGTATVTAVIGSAQSATLVRSADSIEFSGGFCGSASVSNTDQINISAPDTTTTESLTISLAGGTFTNGSSDIGIAANVADTEPIAFVGTSGPDEFVVRGDKANLDAAATSTFEVTYPIGTRTVTVDGGAGDDSLTTDTYVAAVSGRDGDDTLHPMDAGASTYDGGAGTDVITYADQTNVGLSGLTVHAHDAASASIDRGNGATDTSSTMESIVGASTDDMFYGSPEADHFSGGAGNDRFLPVGGDDVIDGGPGLVDTLSVASSWNAVAFDLDAGTATGEGTDTYTGIESLEGDLGNDTFTGDPMADGLIRIDGGGGDDLLDLRPAAQGQTVYLSTASVPPPAALWGIRVPRVMGSPYRDRLYFFDGSIAARFAGRGGNDRIVGGPLDDTLRGGAGADRILGNRGFDTCDGGPGTDTITGCEA